VVTNNLRWGIIGPGTIAHRFATQLAYSSTGTLFAVASRNGEKARSFADEFGVPRSYSGYEDLLADPDVDAVYIATVHTTHAEWTIKALEAGKHVLCEKPLGVDHATAMATVEAARRAQRVLVEGYMYRFHPQTVRLLELVADGTIGDIHHIDASFSFALDPNDGRLFDPVLAGGGILDVGGYPVSMALAIVAAASGRAADPTSLTAKGRIGDTGVDEWASAALQFPEDVTAHLTSGIRLRDENRVRVVGSAGVITVERPWVLEPDAEPVITVLRAGAAPEKLACEAGAQYALEADAVAAAVDSGEAPKMTWDDSLRSARVLEQWREAIGMRYPFESPDADVPTVTGRRLGRRDNDMKYGRIGGVDKDISRLVMGCDNQRTLSHASVLFDDFYERGGNAFDTAFEYGRGRQEKLLGRWVRNRGLREELFIISKGAHTPDCDPVSLNAQLLESQERLQMDQVDLYMLHRDNLQVPVGEFVDVLDEHYRAGRIRAFGGSNWSIERIDEANEYAAANGRQGFTALSNHFGLAEAYDLPWAGCRHATDPASKAWLKQNQMPLFPWSSQARGFFARADPADTSDAQLVRCYYSEDNFERMRRAQVLGEQFGVAATAIALAYVLHQPFPTFALFGPRSLAETRTSMEAMSITLTDTQVAWLDLISEGSPA
jgi:predicted dehydrogenase/aryl-alcohol dehydrogenase-like predicted oxidoreductase